MAKSGNVKEEKAKKENKFVQFFKGIKGEFKRITWPSKDKIKTSAVSVFTFIIIWVLIASGMDVGFKKLFEWIFSF